MHATPSSQPSTSLSVDPAKNVAGKRVYQVWKGSNRFFCGGRLIFGPDVQSLLLTLILIVAPVAVFCVFVGRRLMDEFVNGGGIAILVVAVAHTSLVLSLLMMTSGRDPGIIPRNAHPPELEEDVTLSSDWSGGQTPRSRLPRMKDVVVNGVTVKVKYCDTCMLYRPPRCSHCSICNNCVERFDHHCPWVGQCIGRRNYVHFIMFVLSTTLLCFYIFAMCALCIKKLMEGDPHHSLDKALRHSPASAVLMAYAFLATWFVGGLSIFHIYLMSTNQTTYENFRYRYDNKTNPYNEGIINNFKSILCSGIPPSKNDFRKVQQEVAIFVVPHVQSRESVEILSPSRKACGDIDLSDPTRWSSVAESEAALQEMRGNGLNVQSSKVAMQGHTTALAEAVGDSPSIDVKGAGNPKQISRDHNRDSSSEMSGVLSVGEVDQQSSLPTSAH